MMLHEKLKESVREWREQGYACDDYPMIGEILSYQCLENDGTSTLRYLRAPQFLALEVYWYIRLILRTPHIIEIYKHFFGDNLSDFLNATDISLPEIVADLDYGIDEFIGKLDKEEFVKKYNLETLNEATKINYPSYILALAMGAGKTILIGSIIATEFAMSLYYNNSDFKFMKNALIFAPGKAIIESLRELSDIPYERILPDHLLHSFNINLKIEFVTDGKEIPVISGSSYNLIVSNTEKISLRAKKKNQQTEKDYEHEELEANLRLEKIASLSQIGIFSDEAHHTYGNDMFSRLKRVRETIDYIHEKSSIISVINTTGTPYYKKKILKDVIVWYGLDEGIKDNILKNLNDGIYEFNFAELSEAEVIDKIIVTFFQEYGNITLPNGARAKIAFFFKTQDHLEKSKAEIEKALTKIGEDITQILVHTDKSTDSQVNEFNSLNDPDSRKRVILLVRIGIEGWNCPSLFSCALIKEQTASKTHVLQASTRCLRQVSGEEYSAKIFLDENNATILNKQLRENLGLDISKIMHQTVEKKIVDREIIKSDSLPMLRINFPVRRAISKPQTNGELELERPTDTEISKVLLKISTPNFDGKNNLFWSGSEPIELELDGSFIDIFSAAYRIASRYHIMTAPILSQLSKLYPNKIVSMGDYIALSEQVEKWCANYEIVEELETRAISILHLKDRKGRNNFEQNEAGKEVSRLELSKSNYENLIKGKLIANKEDYSDKYNLSFHYSPYCFDSRPEQVFFEKTLLLLKSYSSQVEAFLFTGELTDPMKTDFFFEYSYNGEIGKYFPDFVLVKKDGGIYVIEIKSERERDSAIVLSKKRAMDDLSDISTNDFTYEIIYSADSGIDDNNLKKLTHWIKT